MALTDLKVRKFVLPPDRRQVKLYDGQGLYLLVNKSGKYWRYDCKIHGKRKTFSLGTYPAVSIREARLKHAELKLKLAAGELPSSSRKEAETFGQVAAEWLKRHRETITDKYAQTIQFRLDRYILPELGNVPIQDIDARMLLRILERIQNRGTIETAHRIKNICGQVFRYAVLSGKARFNPVTDLHYVLKPRRPKHMATILEPGRIGELVRAINDYHGERHVAIALKVALYTFVRSGELRKARWNEIEWEQELWRIPPERMKMRRMHLVPLSRQVLGLLRELQSLTGDGELLFPSLRSPERPISDATLTAALRRMDFGKDEIVVHGFRSMASTLLNEQGWPPDAIERQLAHAEKNSVRRAYNHAEHLDVRREMMQAWADYLDGLALRT